MPDAGPGTSPGPSFTDTEPTHGDLPDDVGAVPDAAAGRDSDEPNQLEEEGRSMISRSLSCSWCHEMNTVDDPDARFCWNCGHRANVPRSECDCPRCTATPEQRRAAAQRDMAELLERFNAAGGDLGAVLNSEERGHDEV